MTVSVFSTWFAVLLLLAGCATAGIEDLPPEDILARTTTRMVSLQGFEFLITRSGALAFLDYEETIVFSRAEGRFNAPDEVSAAVRVIAPGLVAEVNIINVAGVQWETNLFSGAWQAADPRYTFNPAALFDPQTGISPLLARNLTGARLRGIEELPELPGEKLYVVEAQMEGSEAYALTFGMIDPDVLAVTLWVDPKTFDLERVLIVDPADPGEEEDTRWQIDFWNFNSTFDIQEPAVGAPAEP